MKAISLHQPWATAIAKGIKTIETRKWHTSYRGDLLICSSKSPRIPNHRCGFALCIVEIYGCVPMIERHEARACCKIYRGAYAWLLRNIRPVEPFPVTGRQGFFNVNVPKINSKGFEMGAEIYHWQCEKCGAILNTDVFSLTKICSDCNGSMSRINDDQLAAHRTEVFKQFDSIQKGRKIAETTL